MAISLLVRKFGSKRDIVIMGLDTLSTLAPIDKPLMVAGAGMFTPWTVAFALGGNAIYIRPEAQGDGR